MYAMLSAADRNALWEDEFMQHEMARYPWMYLRFFQGDGTEMYAVISMEVIPSAP